MTLRFFLKRLLSTVSYKILARFLTCDNIFMHKKEPYNVMSCVLMCSFKQKKFYDIKRTRIENFWVQNDQFFSPCLVHISHKREDFGLKILS